MKRHGKYLIAAAVLTVSFLLFGNAFCAYAADNKTITKGVFIDEVDVGGLTAIEAEKKINDFVDELREKEISIKAIDNIVSVKLGDLGYSHNMSNAIEKALGLGTAGNLIKRYKDLKDIAQNGITFPLEFTLDENKVREFVSTKVSEFNVDPVNASVSRSNGKMIYTDHILGKRVDVEATVLGIIDAITKSWNRDNIVFDAYIEDVTPVYTRDIVEQCNTILGSFSTEYADSAEGRAANLANGARLLNNTLLYPGETFSAYEHLSPFTSKNGYYVAGAYSKGKVIDSVGGGACQVTTTLYNAALEAELEIVERQAHSMTISYVDLSRDAAIAGTYKDLKFKNNTDVPILIQAYTKGRKITFNIWGHETRDTVNRRIEFETRVLSETAPPPDVVEKDPTKPVTYKKVTQSAHTGYRTELYKIVYENDVEVSRTLVNKSSYIAAPRYITVGTKPVEEAPKNPDDSDKDKKNKDDKEQATDNDSDEEQETKEENMTNPDGQLQGDIFWDSDWDEEGLEDD
jgi:vancomycin resistance protein YoaR